MKGLLCQFVFILLGFSAISQQTQCYDDLEGSRKLRYLMLTGVFDSAAMNPQRDGLNPSMHCACYERNAAKKYDVIKMNFPVKLSNIGSFATYAGDALKIKMKLLTDAPIGTMVEILLGDKDKMTAYPDGTHSQYQTLTKRSGEWEELVFKFAQIPGGSVTGFTDVNQLTLLFAPNTSTSGTYYFDDLTGPCLLNIQSVQVESPAHSESSEQPFH